MSRLGTAGRVVRLLALTGLVAAGGLCVAVAGRVGQALGLVPRPRTSERPSPARTREAGASEPGVPSASGNSWAAAVARDKVEREVTDVLRLVGADRGAIERAQRGLDVVFGKDRPS